MSLEACDRRAGYVDVPDARRLGDQISRGGAADEARQGDERIDQLTAQVDQLREHGRHTHEEAQHMAMFVGMMLDLNDAVAAKQSVACVIS